MPGLVSHPAIADAIADSIAPDDGIELLRLVTTHRELYRMGALAPDIMFFAPDFGNWSRDLVRIFADVYDLLIGPFQDFYADVIAPVEREVDKALDEIDEDFLCGALETISQEFDGLAQGLQTLAGSVFVSVFKDAVKIFDEMTPPIQKGADVDDWYWFDVLHYRNTGEFIEQMWSLADSDEKRAFVLGWVTHYASDTIGHETVNALVGGPYRSHNQRHHFIENLLDVVLFDELRGQELNQSQFHFELPAGKVVEVVSELNVILDQPNDVPPMLQPIFEMLDQAMRNTYDNPPERLSTRYLNVEDLNAAYHYALLAIKASTTSGLEFPPNPTEDVLDRVNEAMQDFLDAAGNPPQPSATAPDLCFNFWDPDCNFDTAALEEWAEYVQDSISYLAELAAYAFETLASAIRSGICGAVVSFVLTVKAMLWIGHVALYEINAFIREGLVLAAFLHPDRAWVETHPVAQASLDVSLIPNFSADHYPRKGAGSNEGYLGYPGTPVEQPSTVAAPFELYADILAFVERATEDTDLYARFADSEDPAETRALEVANLITGFGSVRSMSLDVMQGLMVRPAGVAFDKKKSKLPDWNLDADRGYGYLNWTYDGIGNPPAPWHSPEAQVDDGWDR